MSTAVLYSACGLAVIGIGVFGLIARPNLLRRILAFNLVGSGLFLVFGGFGHRLPAAGADPVPQAMVITGIVVALAATALAVNLVVRLFEETGGVGMPGEGSADDFDP